MTDEIQPKLINPEDDSANPVDICVRLAEEDKNLEAFTKWFEMPEGERTEAIKQSLLKLNPPEGKMVFYQDALKNPKANPEDRFIITNLALLSSVTGEKLFNPTSDTTLSIDELKNFQYLTTLLRKFQRFQRGSDAVNQSAKSSNLGTKTSFGSKLSSFKQEYGVSFEWTASYDEVDDFKDAKDIIWSSLTDDDMVILVKRFLPHLVDADLEDINVQQRLTGAILHPVLHLNAIVDPEIGRYFEGAVINQHFNGGPILGEFLLRHYFPSAEFFEKVFNSENEFAKEGMVFDLQEDSWTNSPATQMDSSAFYFALLYQLRNLEQYVNSKHFTYSLTSEDAEKMKDRIVNYLFSDSFMKRALGYFDVDEEYIGDLVFMAQTGGALSISREIVARGEEAREHKKYIFGDILREAERFLKEKGEWADANELRQRVVGEFRFGDYLGTA